jgi:hypothetical protein
MHWIGGCAKGGWVGTKIRQAPYANTHPIQVREEKRVDERGLYVRSDPYGHPPERGIGAAVAAREMSV